MSNDDGYIELVDDEVGFVDEGVTEEPIDLSRYADNMILCMDELQILRGMMARGEEKYIPHQLKEAIKLIRDALINEIVHVIQMSKSRNGNERKTQATHIHISYTGMPDEHPAVPTPEKTRFQFFKRRRW